MSKKVKSIPDVISSFSTSNKHKIEFLVKYWSYEKWAGKRELMFGRSGKTLFRACPYNLDHIMLKNIPLSTELRSKWLTQYMGSVSPTGMISLPLENIDGQALKLLLAI